MCFEIDAKELVEQTLNIDEAADNFFLASVDSQPSDFSDQMAVFCLVDIEKDIIRTEHFLAHNPSNEGTNQALIDRYIARYISLLSQIKKKLGDRFDKVYRYVKEEQNKMSRLSLEESDYKSYCYVLPEFHDDATHAPWGPNDVPHVYDKQ